MLRKENDETSQDVRRSILFSTAKFARLKEVRASTVSVPRRLQMLANLSPLLDGEDAVEPLEDILIAPSNQAAFPGGGVSATPVPRGPSTRSNISFRLAG